MPTEVVVESRGEPGTWVVEVGVYSAVFSGPGAENRAKEYAAMKNGGME